MSDPKRVYSDDEVRAILGRAIDRQRVSAPEGLTHEELLAVARDAGIASEAVDAAAAEVAGERAAEGDAREVALHLRSGFRAHFFVYAPAVVFLAMINGMTTSYPWSLWPALVWGLAVAIHARVALFPSDVEIRRRVARLEARRRRAVEKRQRAAEKQRRREVRSEMQLGARELTHAVERGVATILTATAQRIHEEVDRVGGPPPRVRVDRGEEAEPREEGEESAEPGEPRREQRRR